MQLKVLSKPEDLEGLAEEWNELVTNSYRASDVPFLRHEYITTWWQTLGGGEWLSGELFVVIARHGNGKLAGIAPLFFTNNREGEPALMLIGSVEISDYLDILARPEDLNTFVQALLELLSGNQAPEWRVLDWYNLLEELPTLNFLQAAAIRCGWSYKQTLLQPCPYIPLPGNWENYLGGIDKKQRHEIRRKMRRAEESAVPVRWYIVTDERNLDSEIDDFMSLMAYDPEKERFLNAEMRSQMRATAHAALQAGWLQLAFLEVSGRKAAGYLNFDYANRIWVYNSGINPEFRELSPGWVLLAYLLKWANDQQRDAFDFLRGHEDYKYRFGAVDRFVVRAKLRR